MADKEENEGEGEKSMELIPQGINIGLYDNVDDRPRVKIYIKTRRGENLFVFLFVCGMKIIKN